MAEYGERRCEGRVMRNYGIGGKTRKTLKLKNGVHEERHLRLTEIYLGSLTLTRGLRKDVHCPQDCFVFLVARTMR